MKKHLTSFKFVTTILALVLFMAACGGNTTSETGGDESGDDTSSFPTQALEIIVPYSAGGGTDMVARSFADLAEDELDQPVAVVNREGGGGAVGMQTGISAEADGYTVTMVTVELLTLPHSGLAQFSYEQLQPVALLNEDPAAITVQADAPWDTLEAFIADAENEKLSVGNSGTGAIWHLAASALEQETDANFNHVPFDGAAPAVTALLGGHIDAVSVSPAEVRSQVDAGELKVLGVMAEDRVDSLPEVPTLSESGIDLAIGTWRGLAVPKETPDDVVQVLEEAFGNTAQTEDFQSTLNEMNLGYRYADGEAFQTLLESQDSLFSELIPSLELNEE
ncbi:tripartite tricarboxylate transporter substrate binding protein [Caldalkalibacillus salinus]|uniref:tripartite tricarboxylate transporter substrate binding protein n=1 Tax=Caldalkalibacillus salinus TaxID=2803787 RepID=UPI001F48496D|nr:tripartite tricarboxylate transporter substrate binding protein [Caldalkalibacillus salinus]